MKSILFGVFIIASSAFPGTLAGAPSEREKRLLNLGSALGFDRLQVLTWPDSGDVFRLKVVPPEEDLASKGKFRGYDVLESKVLNESQRLLLAHAFLDVGTYQSLGIPRPVRPDGYGHGVGTMCGGFRPIVALHLRDLNRRTLDVLICFSCYEIALTTVQEPEDKVDSAEGASHVWISGEGAIRLLDRLVEVFPNDKTIRWLRDDRRTKFHNEGRPTRR